MSQTTADKRTGRRVVANLSAIMLVVLLTLPFWGAWNDGGASPGVVTGWAMPNATGTAISLHGSPEGGPGEGYIIAGAEWQGIENEWHDGADLPTCVGTDTDSFTHVSLGLVTVEMPDGGTREQVTWLECLE